MQIINDNFIYIPFIMTEGITTWANTLNQWTEIVSTEYQPIKKLLVAEQ